MAYHANENTEIVSDNLGTSSNPAKSGKQLRDFKHASGNYFIKPNGYSGSAIECYVEMDMDQGGWVLCACFADSNPNSFGMDLVTGGQNESSVKNYNTSKPSANNSALLNKSFINALWHQDNDSRYTDWTVCFMHGRSAGGYFWGQVRPKGEYKLSTFDMYQGIYKTGNLNNKFLVRTYTDGDNTDAEHPSREEYHFFEGANDHSSWVNYNHGRAGTDYHYLVDDFHGGGEWMFATNDRSTPAGRYSGSSNVGSRFWIR